MYSTTRHFFWHPAFVPTLSYALLSVIRAKSLVSRCFHTPLHPDFSIRFIFGNRILYFDLSLQCIWLSNIQCIFLTHFQSPTLEWKVSKGRGFFCQYLSLSLPHLQCLEHYLSHIRGSIIFAGWMINKWMNTKAKRTCKKKQWLCVDLHIEVFYMEQRSSQPFGC